MMKIEDVKECQHLIEQREEVENLIEHMIANPRLMGLGFNFNGYSSISGAAKWREAFGVSMDDLSDSVSDAVLQFAKERLEDIEKKLKALGVELEPKAAKVVPIGEKK